MEAGCLDVRQEVLIGSHRLRPAIEPMRLTLLPNTWLGMKMLARWSASRQVGELASRRVGTAMILCSFTTKNYTNAIVALWLHSLECASEIWCPFTLAISVIVDVFECVLAGMCISILYPIGKRI